MEIEETLNSFMIEAFLPGIKRQDIDLEFQDEKLLITVKVKKHNHHIKSRILSMQKYLYLKDMDVLKVKAKYVDGILKIYVPKKEIVSKAVDIKIIKP